MLRKLLGLGVGVTHRRVADCGFGRWPVGGSHIGQREIGGQWDSMSATEQADLCGAYRADPQRVLTPFVSGVRADNPDASDWDVDAARAEVEFFLNNNC